MGSRVGVRLVANIAGRVAKGVQHSWPCQLDASSREFALQRQWQAALPLLVALQEMDTVPSIDTCGSLISACEREYLWQQALALLQSASLWGLEVGVIPYSATVSACGKGSAWLLATDLFHEMQTASVSPNVITYNSLINACEKSRHWELALTWLSAVLHGGIRPSTVTFNTAISACSKGKHWERALQVLGTMLAHTITPNAITFSSVITGLQRGPQASRAVSVLLACKESSMLLDTVAWNTTIGACEKAQEWRCALWMFQHMYSEGPAPDEVSLNTTISALETRQQWRHALWLMAAARGKHVHPDTITYNAVMGTCEGCSQWEAVVALWDDLRQGTTTSSPSIVSFNVALTACGQALRWRAALELLSAMGNQDCWPNAVTLGACVQLLELTGQHPWQYPSLRQLLRAAATDRARHILGPGPALAATGASAAVAAACRHGGAENALQGTPLWHRASGELHKALLRCAGAVKWSSRQARVQCPVLEEAFVLGGVMARIFDGALSESRSWQHLARATLCADLQRQAQWGGDSWEAPSMGNLVTWSSHRLYRETQRPLCIDSGSMVQARPAGRRSCHLAN